MNPYQAKVRRRLPHHQHPSVGSDADSPSRSIYSRKTSVGNSTLSDDPVLRPRKRLGPREYLLLLIEMSMALTAYVIRERNLTETELARHELTYRATEINMLHYEGYSAFISMFVGCLADSYVTHHTMALLSVILHFAIICMVAMERAINRGLDREDYPYEDLVESACIVALVLIKSTDFTRLVYGLEGMVAKKSSAVRNYIFLHFWVSSSASYGGLVVNLCLGLYKLHSKVVVVSFIMCGLSLFLFVVFLRPETQMKENKGLGCHVIGCLLMAVFCGVCRACGTSKRWKRGFFGHVERSYSKSTISKTQELLMICAILLPTLGIVFGTTIREDIFFEFHKIKIANLSVGLTPLYRATLLISMFLSYFVLWPLSAWIFGLWNEKQKSLFMKYLIGHVIAVAAMFYVALWTRIVEVYPYTTDSGYLRVFNTGKKPVKFVPADSFTTHNFTVGPEEGIMLSFPSYGLTLFPVTVAFEGEKNLTTHLSVAPGRLTGYMVVDPLRVVRIRGYIPLREGPPGTNKESKPRLYMYNTALTLSHSFVTVRRANEKKPFTEVEIQPGVMAVLSLEPSTYDLRIQKAGIRETVTMLEGGVYGLMIYAVKTVREMAIDTLVEPNTASPWLLLGFYIPAGLGQGLAYPSLRALLYSIVPHGLVGMSFAFLALLEGVSFWISYIGFITWHPHVNNTTLFLYASAMAVFFVTNMFCFIKSKQRLT